MGRRLARLSVPLAVVLLVVASAREGRAGDRLLVVVPDDENLQFLGFWAAEALGAFTEEGLDVEVTTPASPAQTGTFFEEGDAEAAVLPAPLALSLIARRAPIVLVAKLLANEPIELVVRRSVLEERRLDPSMPLRAKLEGLRGTRVGVAPHPPPRLRALFASEGLVADEVVTLEILGGRQQNGAFRDGRVDALFAHTPFVERAIAHDDAVVLVNLSRGDVPALADRLVHAFAFKRSVLIQRPDLALRAYRALARSAATIHASPAVVVDALAKRWPDRDRRELGVIVDLYAPAVPSSPEVRVADLEPALALFPEGQPKPDLSAVPLHEHVAEGLARDASRSPMARAWAVVIGVAIVVLIAVVAFGWSARRRREPG